MNMSGRNPSSFRLLSVLSLSIMLTSNYALGSRDRIKNVGLRGIHSDIADETAVWRQVTAGISIAEASKNGKGEDAYFVLPRDIGVFDGVGGWKHSGIDSGLYSRHLSAIVGTYVKKQRGLSKESSIDLAKALDFGANSAKNERLTGSSTVCVASLNEQTGVLKVMNLGDSGLIVFRKDSSSSSNKMKIAMETQETLHDFNFPSQIGNIGDPKQGAIISDTSADATYDYIQLQDGDVAVVGSDGLWDNIFVEEMIDILQKAKLDTEGGVPPPKENIEKILKAITSFALSQSTSRNNTPWSVALKQELLKRGQYFDPQLRQGGKPDDITVIVSYFQKKL
jgi:protein phosphatase PTC7